MTSGYRTGGTDLDLLFAPQHAGWPHVSITSYEVSGIDLNMRYAPLSTGSASGTTGYKLIDGTDLNTFFAALGSTTVTVGTQPGNVSGASSAGNPSGTVTSNTTTCAGAKGGGTYDYTWNFSLGAATFTNPHSATTAVSALVNAASTVSGTMFCTISDGVTSVNTNQVAWSLQNTSPSNITFAITVGQSGGSQWGYSSGVFGAISGVSGGPPGISITQCLNAGGSDFLRVSGFSSDPGSSWFNTVTDLNTGGSHTGSSATYSYSSGAASWQWPAAWGIVHSIGALINFSIVL